MKLNQYLACQAMRAEMLEDYDRASKILDTILDEDDSNSQAKKRKIAMLKVDPSRHFGYFLSINWSTMY